jgi:hypothetical protein
VEEEDVATVLIQAEPPASVHFCRLPPFEPCQFADLQDWLDQRLPSRVARTDIDVLGLLGSHLTNKFLSEFSYLELRQEVNQFLQQRLAPTA